MTVDILEQSSQKTLKDLKVKFYADGAELKDMVELLSDPLIKGVTTNPSLMKKAGVKHYEEHARKILDAVRHWPVSFEVIADDFQEMEIQAEKIATWGSNVYVKIPIVNTQGQSALPLIQKLTTRRIKLNVTAILETEQVSALTEVLNPDVPVIVSVFAGRIADTGRDPKPSMKQCAELLRPFPKAELLWASVREVLNIYEADACGCHIVTIPHDILRKAIALAGKNLGLLSLDTAIQFYKDACSAGFSI